MNTTPCAVAGHDAIIETEEDPEVAACPGGVIDVDAEGAVGGDPADLAPVPVLVTLTEVVDDEDAMRGHIGDQLAGEGDPVRVPAVGRLVLVQLHARLTLTVLGRPGENRVLPEDRGRGLGQVGLVGMPVLPLDINVVIGAHQRVAQLERRVGAEVRESQGVTQFMDGPLEVILVVEAHFQAEVGADLAGDRVVVDDRRAAVAGAADPSPVAEPFRAVADVAEGPPDVSFAIDPQLPLGLRHGLVIALRMGVERVGGRAIPLHIGHLDRPVGVAREDVARRPGDTSIASSR